MRECVWALYFSPTGGTKKAAIYLAESLGKEVKAAKCPAGAISKESPGMTDREKCILCLRCLAVCPIGAKKLPDPAQEMLGQKLLPLKDIRRENELFL